MCSDRMNRVKTSVNRADRPYISHQKLSKGSQYALCNSSSYVAAALVSISPGQRNLMKTYHNDANTIGITKIALKIFFDFFGQRR